MIKEFQAHIEQCFPDLLKTRFVIACSGGLDSVVLARLCARSGYDFALAHCNFRLRGEESKQDSLFVQKLADELKVYFHLNNFDTTTYAATNKLSIQLAARELRYQWFRELMKQEGYFALLTAHHADDALETFIINLSRATGLQGLTGIPPASNQVYRPLLIFSRADIEEYAKQHDIAWREDSSNQESVYLRNKIRHDLVPVLKELHPEFLQNFQKTQFKLQSASAIIDEHINTIRTELFCEKEGYWSIPIKPLRQIKPQKAYIYALFNTYGFTDWDGIYDLLDATSGKEIRSATHRLIRDRECLLLAEIERLSQGNFIFDIDTDQFDGPISLEIEEVKSIGAVSNSILYVDKETLNHRLEIRKWKKGDYFYPLGMRGKKLVSKFFKDEKMSALEKEAQWLMFSGDRLVWVIGKRADDRFKVGPATKNILRFRLEG